MKGNKRWYLLLLMTPLPLLFFLYSGTTANASFEQTTELTKIRNIGHRLLLSSRDSFSRVMPVEKSGSSTYRLVFEQPFIPNPDSLLLISMQRLKGYGKYALELWDSKSHQMVYSFVVSGKENETILSCLNRPLPRNYYEIVIKFETAVPVTNYLMGGAVLLILLAGSWLLWRKRPPEKMMVTEADVPFIGIGGTRFYPQEQKIIQGTIVTELTAKETQVLSLLAQTPNIMVERSRLQKEIWEDQGVIVTRSLDIFISRLRKKLSGDSLVKIINVHSKGYKLVIADDSENRA